MECNTNQGSGSVDFEFQTHLIRIDHLIGHASFDKRRSTRTSLHASLSTTPPRRNSLATVSDQVWTVLIHLLFTTVLLQLLGSSQSCHISFIARFTTRSKSTESIATTQRQAALRGRAPKSAIYNGDSHHSSTLYSWLPSLSRLSGLHWITPLSIPLLRLGLLDFCAVFVGLGQA